MAGPKLIKDFPSASGLSSSLLIAVGDPNTGVLYKTTLADLNIGTQSFGGMGVQGAIGPTGPGGGSQGPIADSQEAIAYSTDGTYSIPAGYLLEKIIPNYGFTASLKVSLVALGDFDVVEVPEIFAGWSNPIVVNIFAPVSTTVYLSDIPASSVLVFVLRKIKMVP